MDFMHQTVASTIVKYFAWLFDNDGIINSTHLFISYNILVFGIFVVSSLYHIILFKYTFGKAILCFAFDRSELYGFYQSTYGRDITSYME